MRRRLPSFAKDRAELNPDGCGFGELKLRNIFNGEQQNLKSENRIKG